MDIQLRNALNANPDFSEQFTSQINSLANKLADRFKVSVYHDTDMNYKASQELHIYLDKKCQYVERITPTAKYCLRILLSSKGKYATIILLMAIGDRAWSSTNWDQVPAKLLVLRSELYAFLAQNKYRSIPEEILGQIVPEHYTIIDERPASVLNVLFVEEV